MILTAISGASRAASRSNNSPVPSRPGSSTISDQSDGAIDQFRRLEHLFVQVEAAGVDARQIEHLVDHVLKMIAALANETDIFGLSRLEGPGRPVLEHLGEAEDRIEGCA